MTPPVLPESDQIDSTYDLIVEGFRLVRPGYSKLGKNPRDFDFRVWLGTLIVLLLSRIADGIANLGGAVVSGGGGTVAPVQLPIVVNGSLAAVDDAVSLDVTGFVGGASVAFDIDVVNGATDSVVLALEGRTAATMAFRSYDISSDTFTLTGNQKTSAVLSYPVAEYRLRLVSATGTPIVTVSARAVEGGALV